MVLRKPLLAVGLMLLLSGRAFPSNDSDGLDLAEPKTQTVLFAEPTTASTHIRDIKPGRILVLVSRDTISGWANVIDYATGRQGWVLAVRLTLLLSPNPKKLIDLKATSVDGDSAPLVSINNGLDIVLYIHIAGSPEVEVPAHSQKTISVPPGIRPFNASGPKLMPRFGNHAFIKGEKYEWVWGIGIGKKAVEYVDPAKIKAFQDKQNEVTAKKEEIATLRKALDDVKVKLDADFAKQESQFADIEARRKALDHNDDVAITEFNRLVDKANDFKNQCAKERTDYNESVDSFNDKLRKLKDAEKELQDMADSVNGKDSKQ